MLRPDDHADQAPVTFVDSLPRSVAGKMMKHRLIEQLARS